MLLDFAKRSLRWLVREIRFPILTGPNRLCRWSLPTRTRFLRGNYEPALTDFVRSTLRPGDTFWDVGGHFGYYTLLGSRAVGDAGHVYAFEPSAENLWYLNHHVAWNQRTNVSVQPFALGGRVGTRCFGGDGGTGSGQLDNGHAVVHVETIDALVASGNCRPPTFIKVDVQGAETEVLRGAEATLRSNPAALMISTHGDQIHAECLATLARYNCRLWDYPARKTIIAATASSALQSVSL